MKSSHSITSSSNSRQFFFELVLAIDLLISIILSICAEIEEKKSKLVLSPEIQKDYPYSRLKKYKNTQ
jgi:hypothetical protein